VTARLLLEILRAEGAAAVRDRWLDRMSERRQRAGQHDPVTWPRAAVLNISGVEASARLGGVPLQLSARLRHESAERPVALLARDSRGGFRLECRSEGRLYARAFPGGPWTGDPLGADQRWIDAVRTAVALTGAAVLHVENLAGLSLVSLADLAASGPPLVVSLHDFAAFCRRPHLWQSDGGFCGYSTDAALCGRCLAGSGDSFESDQSRHRGLAALILQRAVHVIFPSEFLRARLAALLLWERDTHIDVVAPGLDYADGAARSERRPNEVAFIGGGADHKGGARWPSIARALTGHGARVTVYGGNGHNHLRQLRDISNVRVRGYFRAGSLPSLLANQGAAVALLLPGVPETFSLALSDAWAAGVPVVAPDRGALGERLASGGGRLLREAPLDRDVVAAIDDLRQQRDCATPQPTTAQDAAAGHLAIYRRRGWINV